MEAAEKRAAEQQIEQQAVQFRTEVQHSRDLTDNLQALVDHLKQVSGSSAVYVGKVVMPIKPITEDADDVAHIDPAAVPQIQFLHSNQGADFMVDQILKQE